jgi:hypothetical protein
VVDDSTDPGVRGTINPSKDDIVFREYQLDAAKVDRYKPFDQARSDARQPIRVVITRDQKKYIMQGNHRVAGAQEDSLESVGAILYSPEQWEAFTGLPFLPGGTNNPYIG